MLKQIIDLHILLSHGESYIENCVYEVDIKYKNFHTIFVLHFFILNTPDDIRFIGVDICVALSPF